MLLLSVGYLAAAIGLAWHLWMLYLLILVPQGTQLTIGTTASVIGLELVLVAMISGIEKSLRGLSGGMLLLAGITGIMAGGNTPPHEPPIIIMNVPSHIRIYI